MRYLFRKIPVLETLNVAEKEHVDVTSGLSLRFPFLLEPFEKLLSDLAGRCMFLDIKSTGSFCPSYSVLKQSLLLLFFEGFSVWHKKKKNVRKACRTAAKCLKTWNVWKLCGGFTEDKVHITAQHYAALRFTLSELCLTFKKLLNSLIGNSQFVHFNSLHILHLARWKSWESNC